MTDQLILVVDDNEENVAMLSRWLRRRGFTVLTATDGEQAIAAVRTHQPHLVFMDVSMPIMSGVEATTILRADPVTADVPIIAVTAHAMIADRRACLEAGCNAVATKPVDFEELTGLIELHFNRREPAAQSEAS